MSEVVLVQIPVSREAAEALGDEAKRQKVGRLVSDILRPSSPERDPLAALITEVKAEAAADGLTAEEIDAELAAYNAEGRV